MNKLSFLSGRVSAESKLPMPKPWLCRLGLHAWGLTMTYPWTERMCERCRQRQILAADVGGLSGRATIQSWEDVR